MEPGKTIEQVNVGDRASLKKQITEADVIRFAEVEVIEKIAERNRICLKTVCRNQDGIVVIEGEAVVLPRRG